MSRKFFILNGIGLLGLIAATLQGWVWPLIETDRTYMTAGIFLTFLIGLVMVLLARWTWVDWLAGVLPALGLLGTFIGFAMAVNSLSGPATDMAQLGLNTALNTTIAGIIGSVWLQLNERVLK
jgi:peptidoglycan/LPS O-acetylase OafA/YrhL